LLLLACLLLIALLIPPPPPALADSTGCTGVRDGQTCFSIRGQRTFVEEFEQSRLVIFIPPDHPAICNYYAHFTVEKDGRIYWEGTSDFHKGCWYYNEATRKLKVNHDFLRGSKACGTWWESDSRLGTACNRIF
jgi:hypothetical protein